MPEFTLTLRSGAHVAPDVCAWLLPHADCHEWLREIAGWDVDQAALRFVPIPASATDISVTGALIVPDKTNIRASERCIPYTRIAGRVYVPLDSEICPGLSDGELEALFAGDYVYIWHPGIGLIAAEDSDVMRAADLIAPLRPRPRQWNRAVPGLAIIERLSMLAPHVELSFQQLLEKARDDIGTQGESLPGLPESPTEPGDGWLDKAGRALAAGTAGAIQSLINMLPSGSEGAAWLNKLREMIANRVNRLMTVQEHLRHKEISRLLHLLDQDPDKGLKFALPLNALLAAAHRGLAPPSNRLSKRKIDFNLGRLGGGRPADFWHIAEQFRQRLLTKYRELANRELHLGRYRRAAYIFAELLGDLDAAAMALANGHHFREAAIIYRERLKRPLAAAKCLEGGGLLSEAIEQYEELQMYEEVGNLYTKLGDQEKAYEAYRDAATRFSAINDYLSAARIWDEKLSDSDQAIAALQAGWPHSPQASQCARSLFALLARTANHQAAHRQILDIVSQCPETKQYVRSAEVLAELVEGGYPMADVCERAGDALQQVVSNRLQLAERSEAAQLVAALSKLAPHDRLLERDGRRFVSAMETPSQRPLTLREKIRVLNTITLGLPGCWQTAAVVNQVIVVAGVLDHRMVLTRCHFAVSEHDQYVVPWPKVSVRTDAKIELVADPWGSLSLGVYVVGENPLPRKTGFARTDTFSESITVGALTESERPIGVARGMFGSIYTVEYREAPVVQISSAEGDLISTHHLPIDDTLDWGEVRVPLPLHARRDHLYIAIGRILLAVKYGTGEQSRIELNDSICHIAGSATHTRPRIVIGTDVGAFVLWDSAGEHKCLPFVPDMAAPLVGINRGGFVIAAADSTVEVYDSKEGTLSFVAKYNRLPAPPISILPSPRTDQFAVVTSRGDVIVFEV
jgi:tetratricopeptide (TPR) repeat protein